MKRFYFIFGITAVLVLIILFYNPNAKYLGVYKESMTIEYDFEDIEGYDWFYDVTSDIFDISATSGSKWKLLPKKDGVTTITFYYKQKEDSEDYMYSILYDFEVEGKKIIWTKGVASGLLDYPNPY